MGRGGIQAEAPAGRQRLDTWIWFARLQRSRRSCADLIRAGHVRLNGRREVSPGAFVAIGDVLTLALPGRTTVVRILAFAERRQGDDAAKTLFIAYRRINRRFLRIDAAKRLIHSLASARKAL